MSLGEAGSGLNYTYHSGNFTTTIDYILADIEACACIECCQVHEDTDLNSSDHLPLSVTLSCSIPTQFAKDPNWVRIDWAKAGESEAMLILQRAVSERLKPYIQGSKGNIDHINREIEEVRWNMWHGRLLIQHKTLLKPKKTHRFRDKTLSQLCAESKKHGECGVGKEDFLLALCMSALQNEVLQRKMFCAAMEERKHVQSCENLF